MPESDLVKTGIKGLDEVLFGGIPRGNIILVAGTAGTGKTTLGVEFVYRGARQFNEPGVIVLFEVAPDKLIRDAALFGWDLRELERDGRLKMVFPTRRSSDLRSCCKPTACSLPRPPRLARGGSSSMGSSGSPSPMAGSLARRSISSRRGCIART